MAIEERPPVFKMDGDRIISELNRLNAAAFESYLYDRFGIHRPWHVSGEYPETVWVPDVMRILGMTPAGLVSLVMKKVVPPPRRVTYGRVAWQNQEVTVKLPVAAALTMMR